VSADIPRRMSVQLEGPYPCLVEYVKASDYDALVDLLREVRPWFYDDGGVREEIGARIDAVLTPTAK
jgi:hypothetical protein